MGLVWYNGVGVGSGSGFGLGLGLGPDPNPNPNLGLGGAREQVGHDDHRRREGERALAGHLG